VSSRPECPDCGERWCTSSGGCVSQTPPPPYVPRFYLCFLDFETTGLDPRAGAEPIEVAALVTDDRLNELGRFESLIAPQCHPDQWDKAALEMHARSGLLVKCLDEGAARSLVGLEMVSFLLSTVPGAAQLHLAGNSVHFGRGFLAVYWPAIERRFHHRHLDVSSIRLAASVFAPDAPPFGGEKPHRAMPDVLRSIEELRHWRAALRES
jgi:oligoribonuclease